MNILSSERFTGVRYDAFSPVFIHRMHEFSVTSLQIIVLTVGHAAARLGDIQQPLLLG